MYEDGYIPRGQTLSICIGNKMKPCSRAAGEERVSKAWQWLAIEAPVFLLGFGKFVLLFIGILSP
jgi:hypothetical protein